MTPVKSIADILGVMNAKDAESQALVRKAYEFSEKAHLEQKRFSGEPYFTHVAATGYMIAEIGMDPKTIAAGLLHDTMEDAGISAEVMEQEFGSEVLSLVRGVTKLGALRYRGMERHTESLRKLFAATAEDIRVLIIKLLDRLHNTKTLEFVPVEKRQRIALETLEIYAPIADRLGMSVLKTELEDACFPYAYPDEYQKTHELLRERKNENEKRLEKLEKDAKRELAEAGILNFRMESRVKGVYSMYKKLERKDWDISKIFDILALRIIVPSIADCYTVLGIVHKHWRPVPGKIKDYIAFPKPNGYQSIHTTVYTGDGSAIEIQIRTETQHREAQFGIASHLTYKEVQGYVGGSKGGGLEWIRQFIPIGRKKAVEPASAVEPSKNGNVPQWVKELAGAHSGDEKSEEYLDKLKSDFFSHRVFVFTPRADVIDLPLGATPVDFAYAIHSDVANKMSGARVNGKMVSLDSALRNGDIVEIITKPAGKPTRKWLDMAKTTLAKKMIRASIAESRRVHKS